MWARLWKLLGQKITWTWKFSWTGYTNEKSRTRHTDGRISVGLRHDGVAVPDESDADKPYGVEGRDTRKMGK